MPMVMLTLDVLVGICGLMSVAIRASTDQSRTLVLITIQNLGVGRKTWPPHQVAGGHGGPRQRRDDEDGGEAAGEHDGLPCVERRADDLGRDAGALEALQQLVVLRNLQGLQSVHRADAHT